MSPSSHLFGIEAHNKAGRRKQVQQVLADFVNSAPSDDVGSYVLDRICTAAAHEVPPHVDGVHT